MNLRLESYAEDHWLEILSGADNNPDLPSLQASTFESSSLALPATPSSKAANDSSKPKDSSPPQPTFSS